LTDDGTRPGDRRGGMKRGGRGGKGRGGRRGGRGRKLFFDKSSDPERRRGGRRGGRRRERRGDKRRERKSRDKIPQGGSQCMNKYLLVSEQMPNGIKQNEWEWLNAITLTRPTSSSSE